MALRYVEKEDNGIVVFNVPLDTLSVISGMKEYNA